MASAVTCAICKSLAHNSRHITTPAVHQSIFGRPFVKRFALCYRTLVCLVTLVYCGQMVGWSKMPLGTDVGLGPGHIVLHEDPASPPPKKGGKAPNFQPMSIVPNGWMDQEATWYGGRLRLKQHCVRRGPDPAPPKKEHRPHFSAHVYCGQTTGWIKMALGTEVGLGPGHIVLDGDPAPPPTPREGAHPQFSAHVYCGQTVAHLSYCWALVFGSRPRGGASCVVRQFYAGGKISACCLVSAWICCLKDNFSSKHTLTSNIEFLLAMESFGYCNRE